jgi:hypothetical protein
MAIPIHKIRQQLGLLPVKVFRKEAKERAKKRAADPTLSKKAAKEQLHRQMGRTTEILLEAVHFASKGHPVMLRSFTPGGDEHLRGTAREYCSRLNINPKLILLREPPHEYDHPELKRLQDH